MSMNLLNDDKRLTALEYCIWGIKSYPSKSFGFFIIYRYKKILFSGQMEETCKNSETVKMIGVVAEQADLISDKLFLRSSKFK